MTDIDWQAPLEAVHADGRIVPVTLSQDDGDTLSTNECPDGNTTNRQWRRDGSDYCHLRQWRIRNTPQQTPTSDVVGISEQTEVLSVLVEALSAMVHETTYSTITDDTLDEARGALLRARALLPEPVDGDERQAINVLTECGWVDSDDSYDAAKELALAGIERGRAIASGEG